MNAIDATEYRKKLDYELSYEGYSEDVKEGIEIAIAELSDMPRINFISSHTIFIVHDIDDWEERHIIRGAYTSYTKAVQDLLDNHNDLKYDQRRDIWKSEEYSDTGYFWIEECNLIT
jgi:hypothetical protein